MNAAPSHGLSAAEASERLARDETLVDNMGALHLQVMQTAEF